MLTARIGAACTQLPLTDVIRKSSFPLGNARAPDARRAHEEALVATNTQPSSFRADWTMRVHSNHLKYGGEDAEGVL
jgi:hypothetical protein